MLDGLMSARMQRGRTAMGAGGRSLEQIRLVVKIAHMYHQRQLTQPQIAAQLGISQASVSRLLKLAEEQGIVRTTVHVPPGTFTDVEDALERRYGLGQVVVVDAGNSSVEGVIPALGASAASFLEMTLPSADLVGISSWSETLLAAVDAMHPIARGRTRHVVQVLGGLGRPTSQAYATRLTERLAELCHARPLFLLGPGITGSPEALQMLLHDPNFSEVISYYDRLSVILTGIGSLANPSRLIRASGAVIRADDHEDLKAKGAVGDLFLRFFDAEGVYVRSPLDDRVLGISLEQLQKTKRVIAVAGGLGKLTAIRAACRGKLVHTLITDLAVAQKLLEEP
jgi:DNA-binding transcriptional regulator LsrR (DeoR family)